MEEEVDCLLFERINHTITLTERGHELVSYAHQIRALTDEFKEKPNKEGQLSGHIHIVTPDSICEEMVNAHYFDFHSKYPLISIRFSTADTSAMFEMLDRNEADLIITLDCHSYHKDYIIAKEEQLPIHFVTNANSKFAGQKGLSIQDIAKEPFVLTEYGQGYRRAFDSELAKRSIDITPVLEIGRTDMITSVLTHSHMISFLPDFVTKPLVEAGKLCYLDTQIHIHPHPYRMRLDVYGLSHGLSNMPPACLILSLRSGRSFKSCATQKSPTAEAVGLFWQGH